MFKNASGVLILGTLFYAFGVYLVGLIQQDIAITAYAICVGWSFIRILGMYHANWCSKEGRGKVPNYRLMAYLVSFVLAAFYAVWTFFHHFNR